MILGTKVRIFIRFRLVAAYFYSFTPLSQSSEVGYIPVLAYLCLRPCLSVPASVLTRARARTRRHACFSKERYNCFIVPANRPNVAGWLF